MSDDDRYQIVPQNHAWCHEKEDAERVAASLNATSPTRWDATKNSWVTT